MHRCPDCGHRHEKLIGKPIELPREYCGNCDGTGWTEGGKALVTTCTRCGGDGWEPETQRS